MIDIRQHNYYLSQILANIYSDKQLAHILGFKGGTAAMFFYGLPRFSVDLDFNLLDKNLAETAYQKVRKILLQYGKIDDEAQKHFGDLIAINYEKGQQKLKVDISHRIENDEYELKNYLGVAVKIMNINDMFAHKLVALTGRSQLANRDVFDCWFFLKNQTPINKKIVETKVQKPLLEYLNDCIERVSVLPKRGLLDKLGDLLDDKTKIFVQNKLQQEITILLKIFQQFPLYKKGTENFELKLPDEPKA